MQEFVLRFKSESTYTDAELKEMTTELIDVITDMDDEIDPDTVKLEKFTSEIDHEKIAREYLAENTIVENLNFVLEIEENGK